jgi:hypothetical protein
MNLYRRLTNKITQFVSLNFAKQFFLSMNKLLNNKMLLALLALFQSTSLAAGGAEETNFDNDYYAQYQEYQEYEALQAEQNFNNLIQPLFLVFAIVSIISTWYYYKQQQAIAQRYALNQETIAKKQSLFNMWYDCTALAIAVAVYFIAEHYYPDNGYILIATAATFLVLTQMLYLVNISNASDFVKTFNGTMVRSVTGMIMASIVGYHISHLATDTTLYEYAAMAFSIMVLLTNGYFMYHLYANSNDKLLISQA